MDSKIKSEMFPEEDEKVKLKFTDDGVEAMAEMKKAGVMPDYSRRQRYKQPSSAQMDALKKALGL